MTEQKKRGRPAGTKRVLQPKVTVLSVRREWETKHAELQAKFDDLAQAHMALAGRADYHYEQYVNAQEMAADRLISLHRHQGVIIYLENKIADLENQLDDSND